MAWQGGGTVDWSSQQQNILSQTQATLENTSRSLQNSHRVAIETEEIGTAVVAELGQQRETLLRTRQRVTETNEELGRARSTLRKMSYQVVTNKLLLILIIITEIVILCVLIYMRVRK